VERGPNGDKRRERPSPRRPRNQRAGPYEAQTQRRLGLMLGAGRVLRGGTRGGCLAPGGCSGSVLGAGPAGRQRHRGGAVRRPGCRGSKRPRWRKSRRRASCGTNMEVGAELKADRGRWWRVGGQTQFCHTPNKCYLRTSRQTSNVQSGSKSSEAVKDLKVINK
jgi:hypothetical protein